MPVDSLSILHANFGEYPTYLRVRAAFSPTNSSIWKHYKSSFPNTLSLLSGREKNWPADINIFHGYTNHVNSVAFSPDGTRVTSGSRDKTIRIWDARTGQAITVAFGGHTDSITSVAFSPDGTRIASGSRDKTIRTWDAQTGRVIAATQILSIPSRSRRMAPELPQDHGTKQFAFGMLRLIRSS
jgi:WD40 repeat protein